MAGCFSWWTSTISAIDATCCWSIKCHTSLVFLPHVKNHEKKTEKKHCCNDVYSLALKLTVSSLTSLNYHDVRVPIKTMCNTSFIISTAERQQAHSCVRCNDSVCAASFGSSGSLCKSLLCVSTFTYSQSEFTNVCAAECLISVKARLIRREEICYTAWAWQVNVTGRYWYMYVWFRCDAP